MTAGLWLLAGLALQAGPGPGPGTVRGVVRDAADGKPLPNALVTLVGHDRSTITDGRGAYLFLHVAPGEYRVRASRLRLAHHAGHGFVAALRQQGGELGDLSAADGAQPGDAPGADVARPDGEAEDFAQHSHDVVARQVD